MTIRSVALFDLDGSLADYVGALVRDMNELAGPDDEPITIDNLYSIENKHAYIQNRMRLIKRQTNWWLNLAPINSGMLALDIAKKIGFDIHILSKGPKKASIAWKEKLEWCQRYLGEDIDVHVGSDKGLVYGKVLYDDYPEYMDAWLAHRPRGLGIMPVTSYNKSYKHPNVIKWDGTNVEDLTNALKIAFNQVQNKIKS
jgi:5'-nucleotidase